MKPTLRQLAEKAGVSEATVSRVLNRRRGVAEATRVAVLEAVEALGYQHGYGHQLHPATPPDTVGILVPEFVNPIFPLFAQAIEEQLSRRDLLVAVCSSTLETTEERAHVDMLLARRVIGLVFVSGVHADTTADLGHYERLIERALPVVFVNGYVRDLPAPFLATDEQAAARTALRHLADLGHRRIGLVTGPLRYTPSQRWADGFREAMAARFGRDAPAPVVETVYTVEGGHHAAETLVGRDVTAVIAASDLLALGVISALVNAGRRVPEDVSVVGYDDSPLMAFTNPPLTTMKQPVQALARAAANTLVQQLRGQAPQAGKERRFPAHLVARASTGPPS